MLPYYGLYPISGCGDMIKNAFLYHTQQVFFMQSALPQLTDAEWEVLTRADWYVARARTDEAVQALLLNCRDQVRCSLNTERTDFPYKLDIVSGRTHKGNHYQHHPYQVLDYPRLLLGEDLCVLRTAVIYAHSLSCHLLLRGEPLAQVWPRLKLLITEGKLDGLQWDNGPDPWQWEPEWFAPIGQMNKAELCHLQPEWVRLTTFWPLTEAEALPNKVNDFARLTIIPLFTV